MIAFEDPASQALLPILHGLAAAARASEVETITADGSSTRLRARDLPVAMAALARATASGVAAAMASRHNLRRLLGIPRLAVVPGHSGHVLYVNANLWFGLKAGGSVGHVAGVVNGLHKHGREVISSLSPNPSSSATKPTIGPSVPPTSWECRSS